MDNTVVKNALSYALGSDLHEVWRAQRKRSDGTFEPRIKKSKDEAWNASHGTDEVDIANCTFEQLSQEEQDKDRAQLGPAQEKVKAYMDGKIDIEAICEQYNLSTSSKIR